ncbi:ABC transporter ATP-binding protein [Bacillaceae bacterium SAS-127]|nr:ABC transporter ATP-binding protein [Bacillaceae bacterium SAS-127]
MLYFDHVSKSFSEKTVLKDVSFSLQSKEIVGLIGESGSGKSTIAEIVMGIQHPTSGQVIWAEKATCQYVYQNPERSFNPFWTIEESLLEPFVLKKMERTEAIKQVHRLLEKVELPVRLLQHFPYECSGGQKQRAAIARALSCSPNLLIADEITSALDPDTEVTIIELLKSLQEEEQMSILYITHRILSMDQFADRLLVLRDGIIVEENKTSAVLQQPSHAYTQSLIDACTYFERKGVKQ